ncbi:hypothetical protein G3A43_39505 [Paraburkholderia aspalathi]|uniref:hypothetical protein n=1 Tax=Paraburkholderia nemoris TaxID=2793076 RepID=UPI00190AD53D|nr:MULTISPECIES: hypothetical protein [Paraburkholderia]MBK3786299.1 hypothetical protein [Paraburkholderia aspalathi]
MVKNNRREFISLRFLHARPAWVNIPRQSEQGFHGKVNADSTAKRTGFPRHREQEFEVAATRVNGGTIDSFVGSAEWQMSG